MVATSGIRSVLGGTAVVATVGLAAFWGFWGAIEAFHEGWWAATLGSRLLGVVAYLSPCLLLTALGVLGVHRPKIAGTVFVLLGFGILTWIAVTSQFSMRWISHWLFFTAPLIALGLFFILGLAPKAKAWTAIALGIPLATAFGFGVGPAWRVATRVDDGYRGARIVKGNGVELLWAPQGPGWPKTGAYSVDQARQTCSRLTVDGLHLSDKPLDIWRLPTVDEAVRSMARHGVNSGGVWNEAKGQPTYDLMPDKESPLWDPYSEVVYWWTSSDTKRGEPLIVVYHGGVYARSRNARSPSHGFRAVRAVRPEDRAAER